MINLFSLLGTKKIWNSALAAIYRVLYLIESPSEKLVRTSILHKKTVSKIMWYLTRVPDIRKDGTKGIQLFQYLEWQLCGVVSNVGQYSMGVGQYILSYLVRHYWPLEF